MTHASVPSISRTPSLQDPTAVSLERVLAVATLTPAQAAHVAERVLSLVESQGAGEGLVIEELVVDRDGTLRSADGNGRSDARALLVHVSDLIARLAANADRPAARRHQVGVSLLAALARGEDLLRAGGDVEAVRTELQSQLHAAGADRADMESQLSALVAVPLISSSTSEPARAHDQAEMPVPSFLEASWRNNERLRDGRGADAVVATFDAIHRAGRASRRWSRRKRISVYLAVTLLALVGGVQLFDLTGTDTHRAGAAANLFATIRPAPAKRSPAPAAVPARRPPSLAPAADGAIAGVLLTAAGQCVSGQVCELTVRVLLRAPWLSSLSWHIVVMDRCSGTLSNIDSGAMTARAGWTAPYVTTRLPLPAARSAWLFAVVDKPVAVSSSALLVPATGGSCG